MKSGVGRALVRLLEVLMWSWQLKSSTVVAASPTHQIILFVASNPLSVLWRTIKFTDYRLSSQLSIFLPWPPSWRLCVIVVAGEFCTFYSTILEAKQCLSRRLKAVGDNNMSVAAGGSEGARGDPYRW